MTCDNGSQCQTAISNSRRSNLRRRDAVSGLATLGLSTLLTPVASRAQSAGRIDVHHHILPPKYMADLARLAPTERPEFWTSSVAFIGE